jgi:DNA-binding MarR family transcriptional regulator
MNLETPANCTCFNLRKAARAVTQLYDEALKPSGLRATQFSLLSVVENKGPTGITDLAHMLVMDRTTLTRNLKPFMGQKLLEVIDGADRRQRPVILTSRGQATLARALPLWREVQARLAEGLGRVRLTGLLGDLNEAVRQAYSA